MNKARELGRERREIGQAIRDYLGGLAFPSTKADIVRLAVAQHASKEVVETLERLPDERFSSLEDIMRHFGPKG